MPTIPDFANISDIRQRSVPDFADYEFYGDWSQKLLILNERRSPRRYKFEFSFVGNDGRRSQKSGTFRENRNAPDSPDLSPFIPDDREKCSTVLEM